MVGKVTFQIPAAKILKASVEPERPVREETAAVTTAMVKCSSVSRCPRV